MCFVLGMGAFFFLFFVGYFAAYATKTKIFSVDKTYYFLVREADSESVSVWSETVYLDGGAGYVLEEEGVTYVALAAYDGAVQAQNVRAALVRRGARCDILGLTIEAFRFVTNRAAALYEETEQFVFTALDLADLFYRIANGLSDGSYTQREALSLLDDAETVLRALEERCVGAETAALLRASLQKCVEITAGVVYSKDVRYLQLQLIEGVYDLQKVFSV